MGAHWRLNTVPTQLLALCRRPGFAQNTQDIVLDGLPGT
jgi:hypothetical protein